MAGDKPLTRIDRVYLITQQIHEHFVGVQKLLVNRLIYGPKWTGSGIFERDTKLMVN